ncbi:MAG TPA: diguanylate cyclase [Burkholderiales bacterium]|nr:diguanylate cyclase [Burkholderiales bacterium]
MSSRSDARNVIPAGFLLSTFGILAVGALAYYVISRAAEAEQLVLQSAVRIATIERLQQQMLDAESTARLFLVNGAPRVRDIYKKKVGLIEDQFQHLREQVKDIGAVSQQLRELEQLVTRRFAFLEATVNLRGSDGLEAVRDGPIGPGIAQMEAVTTAIEQMKHAERSVLAERIAQRHRHTGLLEIGLFSVMALGIATIAIIFRYMDRLWKARVAAETNATHLAHHDALTGLPNRRLLDDRMAISIARAKRYGHTLAVLCLDLDGFKRVNDTFGHAAGDELLRLVASRLSAALRADDTIARLGGDEFVVALAHLTDDSYATTVAEKIIGEVSAPYDLQGQRAAIGTSVGIALYPRDGDTQEALLRNADRALYSAKSAGKGRYALAAAAS